MSAERVLLVEDDPFLGRAIEMALASQDITPVWARTGAEGLAALKSQQPSFVLLDLGLPDMDGSDVLARVVAQDGPPVVVISARPLESDRVAALNAGADDFLTKPFGIDELMARMQAVQRRVAPQRRSLVRCEGFTVDLDSETVRRDSGEEVPMTRIQWQILALLAANADRAVPARRIVEEVWEANTVDRLHYLRVYMWQLRQRLEADPSDPRSLVTTPGVGYRLVTA